MNLNTKGHIIVLIKVVYKPLFKNVFIKSMYLCTFLQRGRIGQNESGIFLRSVLTLISFNYLPTSRHYKRLRYSFPCMSHPSEKITLHFS